MDDKRIIDLFNERSEQAISESEKKYGKYCYSIAYRIVENEDDAKEIVNELIANDITEVVRNISVETTSKKRKKEYLDEVDLSQMSLFDTISDDNIIDELRTVDIGNMTPLDALNKLYELQNKVKNRWR